MNEKNRPSSPPSGKPKERLNTVYAASASGTVYELPADVAAKHELTESRAKEAGDVPIIPPGGDDEVGGRHRMWLQDGTYRYHSDWNYGPYIWHADYGSYTGDHWHPDPNSPLAYDIDDY